jgi:antitoxin component YwqK of YwqJK toxin-antitoxin module
MEIEMKRGKRNGKFIQRYFDGSVETTATYKNDLLEGVETRHYHTAGPSMQVEYSKGIKHGRVTAWFIDGTIRETGTYVNDMPDGEWLNYDNRGMMIGEGLFDRGTGKLFIYDDKGRLQSETNYVNNKKEGLETHYLSSGEIEKTILFKEDRIVEINGISIENL